MRTRILNAIDEVDAMEWRALERGGTPFISHAFLNALETEHCVGSDTGWEPEHVALYDGDKLVAAAPAYRKHHSFGEFVFDFAWAEGYRRAGLEYYPKLLIAIPFTPVMGPRLLVHSECDYVNIAPALVDALREHATASGCSSMHVLFPDNQDKAILDGSGLLLRRDCQFHWHNQGYADFDDFLASLSASKRKKLKRERRRIHEAGVQFDWYCGETLTADVLDAAWQFHRATFIRHGHEPYLSRAFFADIAGWLGKRLLVNLATHDDAPIGGAIFFRDDNSLYGRYWGASERYHSLHFETCYYQGIDYCIREGLTRFDPGVQGEHKLARGFVPVTSNSAHWIREPAFSRAIAGYLSEEGRHVDAYAEYCRTRSPFRRSTANSRNEPGVADI